MALDLAQYKLPTPSGPINLSQYKLPSPKPQIGIPGADLLRDYTGGVTDAAKNGVQQATEGYQQAVSAQEPLSLLEGSTKLAAGGINTLLSPIAPLLKPVGDAVNAIGNKVASLPLVQKFATSKAGRVTSRVAEDVANLSTIAGAAAGIEKVPAPIKQAATALPGKAADVITNTDARFGRMTPKDVSPTLKAKAIDYTNKALGNTGKKTATTILSNDTKRLSGLETFYTMTKDQPIKASDGSTFHFDPTNIKDPHEMLQAFTQAKQQIWSKVQAGLEKGSSVTPDYSAVKSELSTIIKSPGSTKQARSHAVARLEEIQHLETGGLGDAQNYLQQLNSRLGATFSGANDAIPNKIDAQLAHGLNNALDAGLEKVNGAAVRPLKDMYASLKAIEPDMVKMVQKVLRQNGQGIPQYINDFGNINLLDAVFAHNPALYVAKGVGMKVLAKVLTGERDPLQNLSKAFKNVASYLGDAKAPQDVPTLALPAGTRGSASRVNLPTTRVLPARSQSTIDAQERARILPPRPTEPRELQNRRLLNAPGNNPILLPARKK